MEPSGGSAESKLSKALNISYCHGNVYLKVDKNRS